MKRILIIGSTSAIAVATARLWVAESDAELFLVARDNEKLLQTKDDLEARGAKAVTTYTMDVNDTAQHCTMLGQCLAALHQIDIVLIAHGTLSNQQFCESNVELTLAEFNTNALSVIALLTILANHMEQQQCGHIAVISSVAADRGRPSNYIYGAAKAAITAFCEGMRARLFKKGVYLTVIKPGFVDTPMTKGLPLPSMLVAKPEKIAGIIVKGVAKKKAMIYAPFFWRFIMLIIKSIPQSLFKRLNL